MKNLNLFDDLVSDGFKRACKLNELKNKIGKKFLIDDEQVAIFKIDDEVFALSNVCPHQRSPLIYDGFIEDDCVVCPAHGWMFNLRTGKTQLGSKGLDNYETKIINDDVYVKVIKKNFKW